MPIILFDNAASPLLYPLTLTKAVASLRVGIFTIQERWEELTKQKVLVHTQPYLQALYPSITIQTTCIWIDASILPTKELVNQILDLPVDTALEKEGILIAIHSQYLTETPKNIIEYDLPFQQIKYPWDLFQMNDNMIRFDFEMIKARGNTEQPSLTNTIIGNPELIFIEAGANVEYAFLNTQTGPIYIGKNASIMEGSMIRGPFSLGEGALLKMGCKIYGATTLGPYCVGGGEIKNTIMTGYSNKAHDGYLGDSLIGEWCNFGAGTSNSNVKNTGGIVNIWNMAQEEYIPTTNKAGVIMGDYSRIAINSSINTGTVIGVCSNVFGEGLLPKYIPSFTWNVQQQKKYQLEKVKTDVENWKAMKQQKLTLVELEVLNYIFEHFN